MAELKSGSTIGGYTIWHRGNFDPATKLNANANAVSASKLETPRTISTTGDGTWSVSFDGTTNTTATLTLASTGVTAGTYKAVTVDVKGRVTTGLALTTGLVTSTTSAGTSNVNTTNTNTYLNVVETVGSSPSSAGTSTQIIGAGTVTVTSDTGGKLTITGAQNITGNAGTATKLATARTINGVSFDGTANITVADSTKLPTTGGTVTGALAVNGLLTANGGFKGHYVAIDNRALKPSATPVSGFGAYFTSQGGLTGTANTAYGDLLTLNSYGDTSGGLANALFFAKGSKSIFHYQAAQGATTWGTASQLAYVTDNVASATKLATARTINGVSFDGTANITIADSTKLPLTGGTISGQLVAPNILINHSGTAASGISWYSSSYNSWQDYMAHAGSTGNGVNGNITAPTGTYVTTWARRSVIEPAAGYGWTFETMTMNGTAPSIVAELSINGTFKTAGDIHGANLTVSGNINATQFNSASPYSFLNGWSAQNINTGGVLASNAYADASKVPTNGIYSKGKVHTATAVEIGSSVDGAKDTDYVRAVIHPPTHAGGDWEHTVRDDATYAYYKLKYGTSGHLQLRSDGTLSASGGFDGNASTATKLATARTISLIGDGAGSASFDGSANASINLTLNDVNNSAGTYGANNLEIPTFTLNKKGLLTSAGNRAFPYAGVGQYGAAILYDGLDSYSTSHSATANIVRHLNAVKVDINKSFNDAFGSDVDHYISAGNLKGFTSCADFPVGSRMVVDVPILPDMPNLGSTAVYFETKRTYVHPGRLQIAYGYNNGRTATRSAATGAAYSDWVYTVDTSSISRYRQESDATRIYSPNSQRVLSITDNAVQTHTLEITGDVFARLFRSSTPYEFLTPQGNEQIVLTGGLLASNSYADRNKVHGLGIYAKGVIESAAGFKGKLLATDLRTLKPFNAEKKGISAYFVTEWGLNNDYGGGNYGDFLSINTYHDETAGMQNGLFFDKSGKRVVHYQSGWDGTNWGSGKTLAYAEDVLSTNGGTMNAPINFNLSHADGAFHKLIEGSTTTDGGYIAVGNHGSDRGYVEIGTIDDPDAAIYARKRNHANGVIDEAVILSPDGHTSFPRSVNARTLGVNSTDGSGVGLSLYGGASNSMPDYGIAFAQTYNYGTHGSVVGDWATYFTMTWGSNRGWIFRSSDHGNVASISANGVITGNQFALTGVGTNYIANGNGDAASYSSHNMIVRSHWGIGFRDNQDVCRTVLDTRTGNFSTQGTVHASEVNTHGVRTSNFYSSTAYSFYGPDNATSQRIKCNSILASNTWADEPYVPHLGIFARGDISSAGNITATGNVTAYSDKRIKEDVTVIENALTKVEQLNGVTFKRKDTLDRQTGLLAQEVEAVLPEAVTHQEASEEIKAITGDEEVLAVNYGALTGLLVESIKELSDKLKAQQELIDKQAKLIENLLNKVSHT